MLIQEVSGKYLIVIPIDRLLVKTLTDVATKMNIQGGTISGIGALKETELGYYHLENKDYVRKTFSEEDYELISLNGNITKKDGSHFIHVHASLGRSDFSVFGGHLFEAKVAVTAEIYINPLGALPERQMQESLGLQTISRCPLN